MSATGSGQWEPAPGMLAVIPVRDGVVPLGGEETVAEAGGHALLVGSGTVDAAAALTSGTDIGCAEVGPYAPGSWAATLAPHLSAANVVLLPASPDGRDLAPRLAHALGRPLLAGAISVTGTCAVLARRGGLVTEEHPIRTAVVATLEPGVRGVVAVGEAPRRRTLELDVAPCADAEMIGVVPPDPATMDLADASRIIVGGAGLGGTAPFRVLEQVAGALGVSWGASRVAADVGWVAQDRFIGTTGISVHPDLYIGLGVSGAVQHVAGIGHPAHVVAVNTDSSAPLMAMADLAIVTDAVALLDELAARVGGDRP